MTGLGQSSPGGGLAQTGGPMTASQTGAMSAPQPRKSGAMMAVGFLSVLLVAGGGFGAYRVFGAKPTVAPAGTSAVATSTPTVKPTAAPTAIPTVVATAPTAPTTPTAVVTATAAPTETAAAPTHVGGPLVKTKPTATPTATATAVVKTVPTGRVVGGDL
jgi:cytoskeletal protein RodZ